jgi:transcriptional regulator with XRE-family HTH domain
MRPEQSRAARGWLGWTQADLAEKAKVGLSTVKDYEAGKRTPIANNLEAMQRALEACGIRFGGDAVSGPLAAFAEPAQAKYAPGRQSKAKRSRR